MTDLLHVCDGCGGGGDVGDVDALTGAAVQPSVLSRFVGVGAQAFQGTSAQQQTRTCVCVSGQTHIYIYTCI